MTKIEWTDETWNPIRRAVDGSFAGHGCVKVSPGCKTCYAERMQPRFGAPARYAEQDMSEATLYLDETELLKPLRWKKARMIFVCSMSDLFWEKIPDEWIDRIFAVMALAPQHTFQVLTKRAERMRDHLNMYETQEWADLHAMPMLWGAIDDFDDVDLPEKTLDGIRWLLDEEENQERNSI